MIPVQYDSEFVESEQGLVVKTVKTGECPTVFEDVLADSYVVVSGDKIEARITGGFAYSFEQILPQINFVLQRVKTLITVVPTADLMKISEIPKVNHTMRLKIDYQPDGTINKPRVVVWNVRIGKENHDLLTAGRGPY